MSLTRKMLKEMGISDENIESIISAHSETVEALKQYKEDSDRLQSALAEIESLKTEDGVSWKDMYSNLEKQFEEYKEDALRESTIDRKKLALGGLLRECGVSPECIPAIIKVSDLNALVLNQDGTAAEPEEVKEEIVSKWRAFIPKTVTVGARIATPPKEEGGRIFTREDVKNMSPEEINRNYQKIIKDLNQERSY